MNYWLYIVKCSDSSFYTGITRNIEKRIWEHNNSVRGSKYIRGKRPVILVYKEKLGSINKALKREKEIKGWNRKKKFELINNAPALKTER